MAAADPTTPSPSDIAQRELLGHFFRMGTPLRFAAAVEAELVRDGDDTMEPRAMWAAVFRRAVEEHRLAQFWLAVARRTPALCELPNPFTK